VGGSSQHIDSCVPRNDEQAAMQSNCQFITIINCFITSAKEVVFYPSFVCLSVCLLADLRINHGPDLDEKFTRDVTTDKEEILN